MSIKGQGHSLKVTQISKLKLVFLKKQLDDLEPKLILKLEGE